MNLPLTRWLVHNHERGQRDAVGSVEIQFFDVPADWEGTPR